MALVDFVCNLCGTGNRVEPSALSREVPSCSRCGSTVRFRSIAQLLVRALTGVDQILPRLPRNRHVLGVGLSDAACYAEPLASRFGYTNTFYHQPPKLDITAVPGELAGRYYADTVEHFPDLRSRSSANDGARQLCNRTRIGRTRDATRTRHAWP